jgi:hypothetical protein
MNVFARAITTTLCASITVFAAAVEQLGEPKRQPEPTPAPAGQPASVKPVTPAPATVDRTPPVDKARDPAAAQPEDRAPAVDRYPRLEAKDVESAIAAWDPRSQNAARAMIARYGLPNEMTSRRLFWYENGPWLWTCVRSDPVMHNWPRAHAGVIEQAVPMRIDADRVGELVKFSGAVLVDRNAGVVCSRNDSEEANILAVNLASQILAGTRDAESARRECERLSLSSGEPSPLTERFTFAPAAAGSGDPDREVGAPGSPSGAQPTPVKASPPPIEKPRVPIEDRGKNPTAPR